MSEPLLRVSRLDAYYGPAHILQAVEFEMGEESIAIVGRNGMGKTTLCAAIMGFTPPRTAGSVRFKGTEIRGVEQARALPGVEVFHAGTRRDGDRLLANGGRVLCVAARGKTVADAQARAYAGVHAIDWPQGFYRGDIGWRAVARERKV